MDFKLSFAQSWTKALDKPLNSVALSRVSRPVLASAFYYYSTLVYGVRAGLARVRGGFKGRSAGGGVWGWAGFSDEVHPEGN